MSNNHKEYDEKNNAVKSEKDKMQVQFQALKKRMNTFREEERAKLIELSLLSGKTIKTLKSQVERAENIIKLAEMNQKLETEEEKVIPFYEESKVPQVYIVLSID